MDAHKKLILIFSTPCFCIFSSTFSHPYTVVISFFTSSQVVKLTVVVAPTTAWQIELEKKFFNGEKIFLSPTENWDIF